MLQAIIEIVLNLIIPTHRHSVFYSPLPPYTMLATTDVPTVGPPKNNVISPKIPPCSLPPPPRSLNTIIATFQLL